MRHDLGTFSLCETYPCCHAQSTEQQVVIEARRTMAVPEGMSVASLQFQFPGSCQKYFPSLGLGTAPLVQCKYIYKYI